MKTPLIISGQIVDVVASKIFPGKIEISEGKITSVTPCQVSEQQFIVPGLIDAHVHIESSMLVPTEFARLAVVHGTTATVSDPHEIANVLGIKGVDFMVENGKLSPFKFFFGAPSCVPATGFESSGAVIDAKQIGELLKRDDILYLSEMMNFPGVIYGDTEVHQKLAFAKKFNKPIDGHAPGLDNDNIKVYAAAGISTDHECSTLDEAIAKTEAGMHILIREGSAARNFDALISLIGTHPDKVMFCSDDKHPDDLVGGHINLLIKRAFDKGFEKMDVLRACTFNPVKHYNLPCGLLQPGDDADFILVDNLNDFNVLETYIRGSKVAEDGKSTLPDFQYEKPNHFVASGISENDLAIIASEGKLQVIQAFDGELLTSRLLAEPNVIKGKVESDISADVLKLIVINRYRTASPAKAFIKGFGLKNGALASTVAHDSHNIICVGTNDSDMAAAINALIEKKGGIAVSVDGRVEMLPLPVAGIISDQNGYEVAINYQAVNQKALSLGGHLKAPFMTLSFMALLVIPELKLSDKGLFDGKNFNFTSLFQIPEN